MTPSPKAKFQVVVVTIMVTGALGVAGAAALGGSPSLAERQSAALAARDAPAFDLGGRGEAVVGEGAIRAAAAEQAQAVPVAPGGTLDDIRWEDLGSATIGEIRALLEANAACDWWRAAAETGTAEAVTIARESARWSTIRAGGVGRDARNVATALDRGDLDAVGRIADACHAPLDEPQGPVRHPICGTPEATPDQPCLVRPPARGR